MTKHNLAGKLLAKLNKLRLPS